MRHVLASAGMALLVATRAVAAQDLTIDWSRTVVTGGVARSGEGPGGTPALELRATASGPTSLHLVTIDHPPIAGPRYVVSGEVRYQGVEGQGYLEMWTVFPDGERFFSRTLAAQGPLAALHGESTWRRFELPFDLSGAWASLGGGAAPPPRPGPGGPPLLVVGGARAVVGLVFPPAMAPRFGADGVRRIGALDAGPLSYPSPRSRHGRCAWDCFQYAS